MKVVVSRHWNNPLITVTVSEDGIALEMDISEFVTALAIEVGNPALLLTQKQLRAALLVATDSTVAKIKQASAQAV